MPLIFGLDGAGRPAGQYVHSGSLLGESRSGGGCIAEAKTVIVVTVVRVVVVTIGATQIGRVIVPRAAPLNPVGTLMPVALILLVFAVAARESPATATNNCSYFAKRHLPPFSRFRKLVVFRPSAEAFASHSAEPGGQLQGICGAPEKLSRYLPG